jgi:hypothetical protein
MACDPKEVIIVTPSPSSLEGVVQLDRRIRVIQDDGVGAASAINLGLRSLTKDINFGAWIGDDDQLMSSGIAASLSLLKSDPLAICTYGNCIYQTEDGAAMLYRPGMSAAKTPGRVLNKIPQPGSIFRRLSTEEFPQLQKELKFAFDEQLFIDLAKHGTLRYVDEPVARYLWHKNSLSAGQRRAAIQEAVGLRWRNSNALFRTLFLIPWSVMLLDSIVPAAGYSRFLRKKRWVREF